ncbi:MAG: hypothetical protein AAGK02_10605 [Pseudomonadota bacterium]
MSIQFTELARRASEDGQISPDELLSLRQLGWGDGQIHREEAEAIFAINNALTDPDAAWVDFFVEAIGEFVLNGTEPRLQCSDDEAQWLISQIDHDSSVDSMAELELIVRTVERAQNVPDTLKHYALGQIENEVLTGAGPTRCGGDLSATHITSAECKLIRRLIFASGGLGTAAVSRFDAEMLFRLKDATKAEANAQEWGDLFVDGVANYMRGFMFAHAQLSHGRRKELESFIADNKANVGRFMGRMVQSAPEVANNFGKVFGKKQPGVDYASDAAEGNLVTENENSWFDSMVNSDGEVDDLEQRLIDRLAQES